MCYVLLLSTTSDTDLAQFNNELVKFSRDLPQIAETDSLRYQYKWYIGSKSGCSCTFRHLYSIELGFGVPVDWYPEEDDGISATMQVIKIIRELVELGESVDCIDSWEHQEMCPVACKDGQVDLSRITNEEFRFFENHHFEFGNAT